MEESRACRPLGRRHQRPDTAPTDNTAPTDCRVHWQDVGDISVTGGGRRQGEQMSQGPDEIMTDQDDLVGAVANDQESSPAHSSELGESRSPGQADPQESSAAETTTEITSDVPIGRGTGMATDRAEGEGDVAVPPVPADARDTPPNAATPSQITQDPGLDEGEPPTHRGPDATTAASPDPGTKLTEIDPPEWSEIGGPSLIDEPSAVRGAGPGVDGAPTNGDPAGRDTKTSSDESAPSLTDDAPCANGDSAGHGTESTEISSDESSWSRAHEPSTAGPGTPESGDLAGRHTKALNDESGAVEPPPPVPAVRPSVDSAQAGEVPASRDEETPADESSLTPVDPPPLGPVERAVERMVTPPPRYPLLPPGAAFARVLIQMPELPPLPTLTPPPSSTTTGTRELEVPTPTDLDEREALPDPENGKRPDVGDHADLVTPQAVEWTDADRDDPAQRLEPLHDAVDELDSVDEVTEPAGRPAPSVDSLLNRAQNAEQTATDRAAEGHSQTDAFELYRKAYLAGEHPEICLQGMRRTLLQAGAYARSSMFDLLEQGGRWADLVHLLDDLCDHAGTSTGERATLSHRAGRVLAQHIGDWSAAAARYAQAVERVPERAEFVEACEHAHRVLGNWRDVNRLLELKLVYLADPESRWAVRLEQALVRKRELGNAVAAYESVRAAVDEGAWEEARAVMTELAADNDSFSQLEGMFREQIAEGAGVEARERLFDLIELRRQSGEPIENLVPLLEFTLELVPDHAGLFRRGTEIVEAAGAEKVIAEWLASARHRPLPDQPRVEALLRAAEIFDERLNEPTPARSALEAAWLLRPDDEALLERLIIVAQEADEPAVTARILSRALSDVLNRTLDLESLPPEQRIFLIRRLGLLATVRARSLGDAEGALICFRAVLELEPHNREALQAVRHWHRSREAWSELRDVLERAALTSREAGELEMSTALHRELAVLAERRLDDPALAAIYLRPLVEEGNGAAHDELQRLLKRAEDRAGLLDLLVMRLRSAHDNRTRIDIARRVVALAEQEPIDGRNLERGLRVLARLQPDEPEPLIRLVDLLRSRGNAKLLADVLGRLWTLDPTPTSLPYLRERAQLLLVPLGALDAAEEAWQQILACDPTDDTASAGLQKVYTARGQFESAFNLLLRRQEQAQNLEQRVTLLRKAAHMADERLNDPRRALGVWKKLLQHRREDSEALRELMRLLESVGDWKAHIRVAHLRLDVLEPTDRLELARKLAQQYSDLHRTEEAEELWQRVLHLKPRDPQALDALVGFAEFRGDLDALCERTSALAELTDDVAERCDLLERRARALEALREFQTAIESWWEINALVPAERPPLSEIQRLAIAGEEWAQCGRALALEVQLVDDDDERLVLERRLARLRTAKLNQRDQAIDPWERVLAACPDDQEALFALKTLYAETGRWPDVSRVLRALVDNASDSTMYAELLAEAARVYEIYREDPVEAFACWRRAFKMNPGAETGTLREMRRLADVHALWESYFEALTWAQQRADDPSEALQFLREQAKIAEEAFGDPLRAFELVRGALALRPHDSKLLADLERLAQLVDEWPPVIEAYDAILAEEIPVSKRIAVLLRAAEVAEHRLGEPMRALSTYATALVAGADPDSVREAMRQLAETHNLWQPLATIYDRLLETPLPTHERVKVLNELAELNEERRGDWERAFECALVAFEADGSNDTARARVWRLAAAHDTWDRIVEVLLRRGRGDGPPPERIAALREVARLQVQRLHDPATAMSTLRRALALDRSDINTLTALTRVAESIGARGELAAILEEEASWAQEVEVRLSLYRSAARILEESGDFHEAARVLRQVCRLAPEDGASAQALADLLRGEGDYAGLAGVLESLVDRVSEERRGELLSDLVAIYRDWLADEQGADAAMRRLLTLKPTEESAFQAHATRLLRLGVWDALDELLSHRAQVVEGAARVDVLHRRARLHIHHLDGHEEAFKLLVEIAQLDPTHLEALFDLGDLATRLEPEHAAAALACAERSVPLVPLERRGEIYVLIGHIALNRLGETERAGEAFYRAFELLPDDIELARETVRLLEDLERPSELATVLAKTGAAVYTEPDPDSPESEAEIDDHALAQWALRLSELQSEHLGDLSAAIETLGSLVEQQPGHVEALERLRALCFRQGDPDGLCAAVEALAHALDDDSQIRDTLETGARALAELDAGPLSVRLWTALLTYDPAHREALEVLGNVAERDGDWDLKVAQLEARARASTDPKARAVTYYELGQVHHQQRHDDDSAETAYRQALEDNPDHGDAIEGLVQLSRGRGLATTLRVVADWLGKRLDQTEDAALHARLCALQACVQHDRARHALSAGDRGAAFELLDEAHRLAPEMGEISWALADLQFARGDSAAAAKLYADAPGVPPPPAEINAGLHNATEHMRRAQAYTAAGWNDEAVRHFQAAAQHPTTRIDALRALIACHEKSERWESAVRFQEELAAASDDPDEAAKALMQAGRWLEQRLTRHERALGLYLRAVDAGVSDPEVLRRIMSLYQRVESKLSISAVVQKLLRNESDPNVIAELHGLEGQGCLRQGDGQAALECFCRALEHSPLMRNAAKGVIDCLPLVDTHEREIALSRVWQGASGVSGRGKLPILELLGEAFVARNDLAAAVEIFEEVHAADRERFGVRRRLVELHQRLSHAGRQTTKDLNHFRRGIGHRLAALRRWPAEPDSLRDLAALCNEAGHPEWSVAPLQVLDLVGHASHQERQRSQSTETALVLAPQINVPAAQLPRFISDGEARRPAGVFLHTIHDWIAAILDDLFGLDQPHSGRPAGVSHPPIERETETMANVLGLPDRRLWLGAGSDQTLTLARLNPPELVLGGGLVRGASDGDRRFLLGRCLELTRGAALYVAFLPEPESRAVFGAGLVLALGRAGADFASAMGAQSARVNMWVDVLQSVIDPAGWQELSGLGRLVLGSGVRAFDDWATAVRRTANRVGFAMAGNFMGAFSRLHNEQPSVRYQRIDSPESMREALERDPMLADLHDYAFSNRYHELLAAVRDG